MANNRGADDFRFLLDDATEQIFRRIIILHLLGQSRVPEHFIKLLDLSICMNPNWRITRVRTRAITGGWRGWKEWAT